MQLYPQARSEIFWGSTSRCIPVIAVRPGEGSLGEFKSELEESVVMALGGLSSTVTNKYIFRIPVPAKISCHVPEKKHGKTSHA